MNSSKDIRRSTSRRNIIPSDDLTPTAIDITMDENPHYNTNNETSTNSISTDLKKDGDYFSGGYCKTVSQFISKRRRTHGGFYPYEAAVEDCGDYHQSSFSRFSRGDSSSKNHITRKSSKVLSQKDIDMKATKQQDARETLAKKYTILSSNSIKHYIGMKYGNKRGNNH